LTTFLIYALVLAMVAAAFLVVPLMRSHFGHKGADAYPAFTMSTGVVIAALVPVAAALLYGNWTTWRWDAGPPPQVTSVDDGHSVNDAITALTDRLKAEPQDVEGWRMLGRSYMSIQRFPDAAEAFRRVVMLSAGDTMAHVDYAEARLMTDQTGIAGPIGDEFIEMAKTMPDNPKVAWYAGLAEFERKNDDVARAHWEKVLAMDPPPQVRQIIEERLGMATTPPPAMMAAAAEPARPADAGPVDEASRIELNITLDPALAPRVGNPVPLFIFARNAAGGPPLAVIRRVSSELPLKIDLSDANTMIEGTKLSDHEPLRLVARLSLSGGPGAQAGDMFGEVDYSHEENGSTTAIVIDQVVP
jgi:cytochrome c-type biogenesis protein CcmH